MKVHEENCCILVTGRKSCLGRNRTNLLNFRKLTVHIKSYFELQFAYYLLIWMFYNRALKYGITNQRSVTIHEYNITLLEVEMNNPVFNFYFVKNFYYGVSVKTSKHMANL